MADRRPVVVDAANVAYATQTDEEKPRVSNLVAMCKTLLERGYDPIFIVEANLRYEVDDPEQMEGLLNDDKFQQAPANTDADYFVLETADVKHAPVVSNDQFDPYREEYGWIEERRMPFMIVDGKVEIYDEDARSSDEEHE